VGYQRTGNGETRLDETRRDMTEVLNLGKHGTLDIILKENEKSLSGFGQKNNIM
jgi:hypothetical protein